MWVSEPHIKLVCHPGGNIVFWQLAIIAYRKRLPGNIPEWCGIYGIVEVIVIEKRGPVMLRWVL
jgi:hypothetical protein